MSEHKFEMVAGPFLHNSIMGALKGRGMSLTGWCTENGVNGQTMRNAMFGMTTSEESLRIINKVIDDAGREIVVALYKRRIKDHSKEVLGDAA